MKKLICILSVIVLVFISACTVKDVEPRKEEGLQIVIEPEDKAEETIAGTPAETAEPETPEAEPTPSIPGKPLLGEDKCNENAALGFISCLYKGEDIVVTLRNVGRGDLQGVYHRFYDASYNLLGEESELFSYRIGDEKEFIVPMSKYTYTKKIDIHPVQANDICSNQQIVVIPTTNCR